MTDAVARARPVMLARYRMGVSGQAARSAGGASPRYPAGRQVVVNTILGHRSTSSTTCPGAPTIGLLPRIRSAVSRIGRPKIYGGSATTSRVRPEQGGYASVHARFSSTVGWKVAVAGSNGATVRSFTVDEVRLPAGEYIVSSPSERVVNLQHVGGPEAKATMTNNVSTNSDGRPKLVFHKYGNAYFLGCCLVAELRPRP